MARIVALHLHERRCVPPRPVGAVVGLVGGGILGDSHAEKSRRAVLVIDRSTLDSLGLEPGDLREQVTVEGLPAVTDLPTGARIRLGGITLQVNASCEPCTHIGAMLAVDDREAFRLLLQGRRGALCTVTAAEGVARVGDPVEVVA